MLGILADSMMTAARMHEAPALPRPNRALVEDLLPEPPFDGETWGTWTQAVKAATGRKGKGLFMPLRKAVTGRERGPEMAALLPLMQVIRRP